MAALVVMGAILTSCAKSEIELTIGNTPEVVEPVADDNIVVCTTTVSFDSDATKALTEDGVKTFAAGDMIAVIYKNTSDQTVKAMSDPLPAGDYGNSASFTVSLTNPADDAAVRIIYPAAMAADAVATNVAVDADATINYAALNTQDGTLGTLSGNLDLAVYDGNLSGTSLPADPALHNKLAICLYTIKDDATPTANDLTSTITGMTISDGTYNYTVNRSAAAGPIYVAIRPTSDATINYTATDGTNYYKKTVTDKTYAASQMYPLGLRMAAANIVNLASISEDYTAQHGDVLYGTLEYSRKISIADGATVTLKGVDINGNGSLYGEYAGLNCLGDAIVILKDGTTNTVKGYDDYPGVFVPVGNILTIQGETAGTGKLIASSDDDGAGIGGGDDIDCGNITINGGTVTATGGYSSTGIGCGYESSCGDISITGGKVTASGGDYAAGIGSSYYYSSCGVISITGGTVTATGGNYAAGIGCGNNNSSCGAINISGGTVDATGGQYAAGIGSGYFYSSCGAISISGGTVDAMGGYFGAGIGSGYFYSSCGAISLSGGTVEATGGNYAAGIGSGYDGECGDITIANTVTSVTATMGSDATNSIGEADYYSPCGTVTIGGTVYWGETEPGSDSYEYKNGGDTYLTTSPLVYEPTPLTPPTPPTPPDPPTPPTVPTGAIDGLFSVSSTEQVFFSQGNLQAVFELPSNFCTWQFAVNQWDCVGNNTANTEITDNGGAGLPGTVDLFGWSTAATTLGIHSSTNTSTYSGDFVDWGSNDAVQEGIGTGWRTLSADEWYYIVDSRDGTRYCKATVNSVTGLVLFPDGYSHPDGVTAVDRANNIYCEFTRNSWSGEDWTKMEAAGCVFLPAAGTRLGLSVSNVGEGGIYWSSTKYQSSLNCFCLQYSNTGINAYLAGFREKGYSVRLVKDAE